jgi:hypothetical protein
MVHKVFVSSTKIDLPRHRTAVKEALIKCGYFPVEMDDFGARDVDPVTGCLRLVAESQLFLGIYAWRYGYVPPGATRSITAEELEQARRLGKPRFCFLVDESYPWAAEPGVPAESAEQAALLEAFKESLRCERMVASFTTPEQLALEVITALRRWELDRTRAPERRRPLLQLLDKVEGYWVKGVLANAVRETGLLTRDREERSGDVAQPWEPPVSAERAEAPLLPPRTPLDLFVERWHRLLILGEGGGGKTTDLLQLAAGLAELARDDPEQPVPVVLKLGSWGRSRRLADWMTYEIHLRHKVDLAVVRRWLDDDRLLPLLDGLDEVEAGCRDACAHAINEFLAARPECGLAVTCRGDVNDELAEPLELRDAYALRPLADASLDRLLVAGGAGAAGVEPLRALVQEPGWRELTRNPLMLVLMARVLRGAGAAALGGNPAAPAGLAADGGGGRRRLLATYVETMLEHPIRPLGQSAARTRRALSWLACQMNAQRLPLFQLADLQPTWLAGAARVWIYAVVSRALGGFLLMLPVAAIGWPRWTFLLALVGLAGGAAAGLLDGRRLRATVAASSATAATVAGAGVVQDPPPHRPAARALAIGGVTMVCLNLFGALLPWRAGENWYLKDGLRYGLLFGALFGLVFGLRPGRRARADLEIASGLTRSRWSWGKCWRAAAGPLVLVVLWWLVERLPPDANENFGRVDFWLIVALVASTVGGLVGGLLGDIEEDPTGGRRRHPGLRPALVSTARAGLRVLLTVALALWVEELIGLVAGVSFEPPEWLAPALAAPIVGLWIAVDRGLDLVQHYTLRLLLWLEGTFPWRWVRLLDQATDCNLMHRVGPGYEFIHPWLLAELAAGAPAAPPQPPG